MIIGPFLDNSFFHVLFSVSIIWIVSVSILAFSGRHVSRRQPPFSFSFTMLCSSCCSNAPMFLACPAQEYPPWGANPHFNGTCPLRACLAILPGCLPPAHPPPPTVFLFLLPAGFVGQALTLTLALPSPPPCREGVPGMLTDGARRRP